MKIFKSIVYTLSQYKFPLFLKYFIIGITPFLLFTYFSAAFLASSFNILILDADNKTGFIVFLGTVLIVVMIGSAMATDN